MVRYFIIFGFLLTHSIFAQDNTEAHADIQIKEAKWDTLKYHKFEYVLIVGIFQQHRTFSNEFVQHINKDKVGSDTNAIAKQSYLAESNLISGLVLNYDKFQLSFGTRSEPPQQYRGKGYTKTFNIGFTFGDNRWVSENYFRRFRGFYNDNTQSFDTTFKTTGNYYLLPGMTTSLLMSRIMYFTNYHEFSYKSGFGCNYRQLRSAATWIVGGSFNSYHLRNDSSVFPLKVQPVFNDYAGLKAFSSTNLSFNFGGAGTLVLFKAWFVNGYFTLGPELQKRYYDLTVSKRYLTCISWSGTGRFSMGLNLRKFYMLFSISNDYNLFNSPNIIDYKSQSQTYNFSFGWRFHTGTPGFYKKFMNTKFYKLFS